MTQEDVARALNVSLAIVQKWDTGARPKPKSRVAIAALFGVSVDDIAWPEAQPGKDAA